ncbi:ABC transporter permease [Chloroflexota bacterium]
MKNTLAIARKEFKSYLTSPMAYVVTGVFLALTGIFFGTSPATYYNTSISGIWSFWGQLILMAIAALLTMRLIAEERKIGTLELLLTAPVRDSEIIIGKFLGSLCILCVMLLLTLYYPLMLILFGDPDIGPLVTAYIGLFLLGSASLAIGLFASSVTSNQIVSVVIAGAILFALWFIGLATSYLPEAIAEVINYFSLAYYFPDFITGIVDTRGIVFYLSITALFLFLAIRSLENSRWN